MTEPFFNCTQLTKSFKHETPLREVTFDIQNGEIISFLGPSGCGKTTLLRCIAGLETVDHGDLFIEGERLNDVAVGKRPIAMMFQQPLLFPHLTVLQNAVYGLKAKKIAKKEQVKIGKEVLAKLEIEHLSDNYPYELSGGQKQRVSLARALVVQPKLILLDEPFSSLDASLKVTLRNWLKAKLKEWKVTAIFVTHDKEEAMLMSDKIAVIHDGIIQQVGTPTEVYNAPKTAFVAQFVSEGIFNEHRFFPLKAITVHEHSEGLNDRYDHVCEAKTGSIFYKGGQKFYQIELLGLTKEILLTSEKNFEVGQTVFIAVNNGDAIEYEGSGNKASMCKEK